MVALPKTFTDPTTAKVKIHIVEENEIRPANSMGMSSIGDECQRRVWLRFRRAYLDTIGWEGVTATQDGYTEEERMIARLRLVDGVELVNVGPDGNQIAYTSFGGHLKGKVDGHIRGVLNASKTDHIWEHKSTKQDKYNKLIRTIEKVGEKNALMEWNPIYYSQAQLYLHHSGFKRHYMTVSTPGGRDFTGLRTEYNPEVALRLMVLAERLIFSERPPMKFEPDDWRCKMCAAQPLCHGGQFGEKGCRTCAHVTPMRDGTWRCERWDKTLVDMEPCSQHLWIPDLVPGKVLDAGKDWVKYEIDGEEWVNREQS